MTPKLKWESQAGEADGLNWWIRSGDWFPKWFTVLYSCPPDSNRMDSTSNSNWLPLDNRPLKLFLLNTRSITKKLTQFQNFIYSNNIDISCVTETWLTDAIYNKTLPTNFSIYRNDRNNRDGSVMIAINNSICSNSFPATPIWKFYQQELV